MGFKLTYKELKADEIRAGMARAKGFKLTYKELKAKPGKYIIRAGIRFKLTYKELKVKVRIAFFNAYYVLS